MNAANPLLNTHPWSKQEDKRLLSIAKRLDYRNWREISEELKVFYEGFVSVEAYTCTFSVCLS